VNLRHRVRGRGPKPSERPANERRSDAGFANLLEHIVLEAARSGQPQASRRASWPSVGPNPTPGLGSCNAPSANSTLSAFGLQFGAILNEVNKHTTQLRILNADERPCQSQSVGSRKKFVYVGRRHRHFGTPPGAPSKKKGTGT
jgi:hypothetical protein